MCCLVKLEVTSGRQSLPKYSPGCFPTSMQNKPVQFFEKKSNHVCFILVLFLQAKKQVPSILEVESNCHVNKHKYYIV